MNMSEKKCKLLYILIHVVYWSNCAFVLNFSAKFLQSRGFSAAETGICLAICYGFSALMQPMLAELFSRFRIRLGNGLIGLSVIQTIPVLLLLLIPMKGVPVAVCYIASMLFCSIMQPSLCSLHQGYSLQGIPLNFGLARGLGSLGYAICVFFIGRLLTSISTDFLLICGLILMLIQIVLLYLFHSPGIPGNKAGRDQGKSFFANYPWFILFLLGLALILTTSNFFGTYLMYIMQDMNPGSAGTMEQGIASCITALCELPAMFFYVSISKKIRSRKLLFMTAWFWALKITIASLSRTPVVYYLSTTLQGLSYAVYVPASADYFARYFPHEHFLRAQSLSNAAFMVGTLTAAVSGGILIDSIGIRTSMILMIPIVILGAILFSLAFILKNKPAPAVRE